jgi:hypothetical protein
MLIFVANGLDGGERAKKQGVLGKLQVGNPPMRKIE